MARRASWTSSPALVVGFGLLLLAAGIGYHAYELYAIGELGGPLLALVLDGAPALALVYAGYWLATSDFEPRYRRIVCRWCLAGAFLLVAVIGATHVVRLLEERAVTEPAFPLLVAAAAGANAGFLAGYYNARATADADRAEAVGDAFAFVNGLIRHDLRNDLTVVRGHAELLEAETDDATDGVAAIDRRVDEALARIETSRTIAETLIGDPDLESVDVAPIAADAADRVETAFDVAITTDVDDATVVANEGLRSVVDNLLENAAEHNDADEPRVHLEVDATPETVRLAVRDNGPGVSDERKRTVFDGPESDPGGLSIVRTLVERYGGEIRVEDNEPRGSVFVVELPRAE